ncbi:hypothetical protein LINGRAHAP2_LOCUS3077 [Linum grandiflorum]
MVPPRSAGRKKTSLSSSSRAHPLLQPACRFRRRVYDAGLHKSPLNQSIFSPERGW